MKILTRFFLPALSIVLTATAAGADQPNIILILADDMGYGDLKAYNPDSKIPTPHLDQLAAEGMTFTDAHSGGSTCKPSRYALLSGEFAVRAANMNDKKGPLLPEGQPTIASMLRDSGYRTAMVGKWHLGFDQNGEANEELLAGFMDQQFGRLMVELDRLKLRDDTIVVFVSDHGYLIGEHEMHKKSKLWEEAIHVPLMISAPGQKGGTTCDQFVELIDLYPTLTELAGLPAEPGAQGLSLVSLLENPASERREKTDALIQVGNGFGLRSGKWAYMWYPANKKDPEAAMLYDMEKDAKQFTNLVRNPEYSGTVKALHQRLMQRIETAKTRQ